MNKVLLSNKIMSGQVNELLAKKDRVIERQSNRGTKFFWVTKLWVDKLTGRQVNELLAKKDRVIERQSNRWTKFVWVTNLRVDKLTSCLSTCWPVHSKTRHKKRSSVTLSFIYPVYKQLVNSSI